MFPEWEELADPRRVLTRSLKNQAHEHRYPGYPGVPPAQVPQDYALPSGSPIPPPLPSCPDSASGLVGLTSGVQCVLILFAPPGQC